MGFEIGKRDYHKRLPEFHVFDRVTFEIVPRYKTSDLSGDEWRQHVEVTFFFKGRSVHSFGCRDMEAAFLMVGAEWINAQFPIPDAVLKIEGMACDQPSCENPATAKCIIKEEFSRSGEKLDKADIHSRNYRQFCKEHALRGDCDREDCDDNYTVEPLTSK